jgi:hypothetical protein
MPEPSSGTVALRFTDIQSSTRLLHLAGRLQAALPALHPLFRPPASDRQHLRQPLDAELRDLLLETNGAEVAYGTSLVWAAEEITQRNLTLRREWQRGEWAGVMPIDHLLFFGELGNGDLVCFPIAA